MSRLSEDARQPCPSGRWGHTPTGVPGSARREVAEGWAAARAAGRRTVVVEALLCVLAAAFGLVPLLLVALERPVPAVLEALWAALLVPVRRGWPVAAVLGASLLVVGDNVWTLAVPPLIVLSATRRIAPPRRAWQVVGVGCAVVGVLTVVGALVRSDALPVVLAGNALSVVLLLLLPAFAGTLLGRRRPLVSLLRERNAYLEQARTLTAAAARMEERNRIAGEMHDLLGHRLSLISVHAGALEFAAARQAPALVAQTELLRTTAGTAMEELREVLGVLRHADLTDPADRAGDEWGTREDITALVAESRQTGSAVQLDWAVPDTVEVGLRTRQAIHRVVREGLTNVLKHASGAPTRVEVRGTDRGVEVSVTNEAPRAAGPSLGGTHSGLAGCHERIALLGGTFEAGALTNGGFRMAAWLPTQGNRPLEGAAPGTTRIPAGRVDHPGGAGHPGRPGPQGARAPLPDEILTWPRVLGSGCAALLVILPTAGFLVVLLTMAALG
ncbi:sensor histidine kinase [Streptomyces lancefieldiae]|uniref:histidine kinase n=1 Tax=Streptomyces lancefieldiae TaxID=3075520 RepID=A0ABU3AZ59_9ACTN|nr:histidine kinase [Streptomyces sp. DSM 40712]MDT0615475.1 histidine kinase [Streptomyces sp. DSM 40712]